MQPLAEDYQCVLKCHFTANESRVVFGILPFIFLKITQSELADSECFGLQRAANELALNPNPCE